MDWRVCTGFAKVDNAIIQCSAVIKDKNRIWKEEMVHIVSIIYSIRLNISIVLHTTLLKIFNHLMAYALKKGRVSEFRL